MSKGAQTIRGSRCKGAGGHGADGVEKVGVVEARVRRRRWSTWVAEALCPPPALSGDGSDAGEHCDGGEGRWRSFPSA